MKSKNYSVGDTIEVGCKTYKIVGVTYNGFVVEREGKQFNLIIE